MLGAQRSGTTSLYGYLSQHPDIVPPLRKEVEFFSRYRDQGVRWYRAHFPLRFDRRRSYDCTPDYLFDPGVPLKAFELLPDAPLVVLLRDPVERAWSAFRHIESLGLVHGSFEEALRNEELAAEEWPSRTWYRHSYLRRGLYADQLERWLGVYPRHQLLVVFAEDLFSDPIRVLHTIEGFVGLERWTPPRFDNWSYSKRSDARAREAETMATSTRDRLTEYFAEPNSRLEQLLGHPLPW
ncbi:MAG: sulfotransferase [Myxococcota bacterium]